MGRINPQEWLHYLKALTDIKVLVKSLDLTPENEIKLWENILTVLSSEGEPISFEEGEDETNSLFGFIQDNIDLEEANDTTLSQLYLAIKDLCGTEDNYWNVSVQKLINYFIENLQVISEDKVLIDNDDSEKNITVKSLMDADAGNNFPFDDRGETDQWVEPWYNIDGENYDQVRKCDEILDTLRRDNKLDYTHYQNSEQEVKKWIRLLMPRYGRKVEVEDLDRNFWVIAQVISAISNYLFGDGADIPKMLEGMAREISELWENVIYLWLGLAAITQSKSGGARKIIMPLPTSAKNHSYHFDGIEDMDNTKRPFELALVDSYPHLHRHWRAFDMVIERLNYLTEQYKGEDLCVLPIVRLDNYKRNWYSCECYPSFYVYIAAKKQWTEIPIKEIYKEQEYDLIISPRYEFLNRFTPKLYSSKQDFNNRIIWQYPFSKLGEVGTQEWGRVQMYGNLRIKPSFDFEVVNGEPKITNLKITVDDAAGDLLTGTTQHLGEYKQKNGEGIIVEYTDLSQQPTGIGSSDLHFKMPDQDNDGYYMGETASWRARTAEEVEIKDIFTHNAYVLKVGNCLPTGLTKQSDFMMSTVNLTNSVQSFTSMRGNVTSCVAKSGDNANLVGYYRMPWENYKPANDGDLGDIHTQTSGVISFNEVPKEYPISYATKDNLKYDGLVAAKNFILSDAKFKKNPCYILTTAGLTAWNGGNPGAYSGKTVYWDSSLIAHLYFYIPSIESVTGNDSAGSSQWYNVMEYLEEYNKFAALTGIKNSDTTYPEIDGIVIEDGKEVGKIISCNIVNRYEGYFYYYGMTWEDPVSHADSTYIQPRWRQFYLTNDGNESYCSMIICNQGIGHLDGIIKYNAKFSTDFSGYVRYYDARWNQQNGGAELPNIKAQVSEAHITIKDSGYKQDQPGKIVGCNGADFDVRPDPYDPNIHVNTINPNFTGFQMTLTQDSQEEATEDIFDLIAKHNAGNALTADNFHGRSYLFNGQKCRYKY